MRHKRLSLHFKLQVVSLYVILLGVVSAESVGIVPALLAVLFGVDAVILRYFKRTTYADAFIWAGWLVLAAAIPPYSPFQLISALVIMYAHSLHLERKIILALGITGFAALEFSLLAYLPRLDAAEFVVTFALSALLGLITWHASLPPKRRRSPTVATPGLLGETQPAATEAAHNLEEGRLRALINSMADAVVAIDDDAKVVLYNGAALNLLDQNATLEQQPLANFLYLVDKEHHHVPIDRILKKVRGSYTSRDLRIKLSGTEFTSVYVSISPVRLGYGEQSLQGYILVLRDITKEKSLEEERDEFISVVSHELRTPVAIAEGNISNAQMLLKRGGDTGELSLSDSLDQAHEQVMFLAGLINDLSTLSRAERGKLEIVSDEIDIVSFIEDLTEAYRPSAEEKGLKLLAKPPKDTPKLISTQLHVREIMQNFLTNAIKYTQKGSVTLGANVVENGVELWVEDTGIGISKSDQKKLFEKFFRSEDYRTRETSGTGLGLYVTLKLAEMLKARITVVSELDKGSRFTVLFPHLDGGTTNKVTSKKS